MNRKRAILCSALALAIACGVLACERASESESDSEPEVIAEPAPVVDESVAEDQAGAIPVLLKNLGGQSHPITTADPVAQSYFDQGMILTFGFNHEAALRSFEEAARLDPGCAMCSWGIALALGPNINAPMGPEAGLRAYAAMQQALSLMAGASDRERGYIIALATRYAEEPPADRTEFDVAYAQSMRVLHTSAPDDLDAAVLFAESLMDLTPWNYWTDDAQPREHTAEILVLLNRVLEVEPNHVGANHYLIHAVEEYYPELGVPAAERLGSIAPDAGHLVHMPSHIFWRVGRYDEAVEINQRATAADESFFAWCRPGAFYSANYYPHNIHFLWAAASIEGRSELAIMSARKLEAETTKRVDEFPFVQEFMAIPNLTLARFGRWDALRGAQPPNPEHRYLTGIWHYTQGLAALRTGDADRAREELQLLIGVAAEPANEELFVAGETANATTLLLIGAAHLEGELAIVEGRTDEGIAALERGIDAQDALVYMEPPPWYLPTRQALGAVLLDAGRAADAEAIYLADLEQYPSNGWSLYGLARSLKDQGRADEASWAEEGFERAWARADVELSASRF